MNLKDFFSLAKHVLELLNAQDPTPLYNQLISQLETTRQTPTTENQTAVIDILEEIKGRNQLIDQKLSQIPHALFILDHLDIAKYVGGTVSAALEEALRTEMYTAATSITAIIEGITKTRSYLGTIIDVFTQLGIQESENDATLLSVQYSTTTSDLTTKQLRSQLLKIDKIVHAFARLTNEPQAFAEPQIRSISKSSPLIIDIGNGLQHTATLFFYRQGNHMGNETG